MNLMDRIREKMGYPPFEKIDPNTQEAKKGLRADNERQRTGQAAITAVLAGFYELSRTQKGFEYLLNKDKNIPWSVALFGDEAIPVVENIAQYGGTAEGEVSNIIEEAGNTTWQMANEELEGKLKHENLEVYFNDIKSTLFIYLPAALQLGKKLNDNSIDDRTHKMDGPVSGLMHKIENFF